MISKLDYKLLSYIKRIPGQRAESEGLRELVKGCRCGSVGANLLRLEAENYIQRSGYYNMAYIITGAGDVALQEYDLLTTMEHPRDEDINYKVMYEQMEELAYSMFMVLLHVPDEVFKNGNTDELGTVDEGLVLHHRFIQAAADVFDIDLTQPIKPREKK